MSSILFTCSSRALNRVKPLLNLPRMSINLEALKVNHDQEANEFNIDFQEGKLTSLIVCFLFDLSPLINSFLGKAFLNYEYISPDLVDLYHTEVPAKLRNQKIGSVLARVS